MNKVSTAFAFAIGLTSSAFLAAQSGTATTPAPATGSTTSQVQGAQPGTITVTGCLQRNDANAALPPTTTSPQATRDSGTFILANATMSGAMGNRSTAGTGAAGTTGTSGSAAGGRGMMGDGRSYTLVERNTGELAPHAGHHIEITGTLMSAAAGTSADGANATATGSNSAFAGATARMAGGMMSNQRLQVSSMRMIAATCPAVPSTTR